MEPEKHYYSIREASEQLGIKKHVLRFWGEKFHQLKPVKKGNMRYYSANDVTLIKGIKHLLYTEGYRIAGVQRILADNGVEHVREIGSGI